jgi:hypothetical protein
MTFSFDASLADSVSLVRFHIGDTDDEGYFLDDETIEYWINAGNAESAVIACIKYILSQLSRPNFSLDWLSVSGMKDAKQGYEELLYQKEREFGLRSIIATSTISQPYRADSLQDTDDTDYPNYHSEFDEE